MSSQLSQEDKMLLGEIDLKGNAIKNQSTDDHTHDGSKSDGSEPNGLIAMAGNLVPVDRAGNKVNDAQAVSQGLLSLDALIFNTLILLLPAQESVRFLLLSETLVRPIILLCSYD